MGNKASIGTSPTRTSSTYVFPQPLGGDPPTSFRAQYKRALSRVPPRRAQRIRQIFDELKRQSNTSGDKVDRASFLRYFPLPGMMGERLFDVFDRDKSGAIDFPEFLTGVTIIYHGTPEEKRKFLFDMYDLDGNGEITKQELSTMLSYIPAAFQLLEIRDSLGARIGEFSYKPTELMEQRISQIVDSVFRSSTAHADSLTYEEFKKALSENSAISEIINIFYDESLPENELSSAVAMAGGSSDNVSAESASDLAATATNRPLSAGPPRRASSKRRPSKETSPSSPRVSSVKPHSTRCPLCSASVHFTFCVKCGGRLLDGSICACVKCGQTYPDPRFCHSCGHPVRSTLDQRDVSFLAGETEYSEESSLEGKAEVSSSNYENDSIVCGYLTKLGRITQTKQARFFLLKDCFLYYYLTQPRDFDTGQEEEQEGQEGQSRGQSKGQSTGQPKALSTGQAKSLSTQSLSSSLTVPRGVIFLPGLLVSGMSKSDNESGKFGFSLRPSQGGSTKRRAFFCQSAKEQEKWVVALSRASRSRSIGDYYEIDFSNRLGQGKFSIVYPAVDKVNKAMSVAVKVISVSDMPDDREFIRTELAIVKLVNHENIVKTIDVFESVDNIYIVLEKVGGGDLLHRLQRDGKLAESEAKRMALSLVTAVQYLHQKGIVHRDIKPENILINEQGVVKLTDFGLSALSPHACTLEAPLGTVGYAAPEVILAVPYDKMVDMWSIGAVTFVMLSGHMPFRGGSDKEVAAKVLQGKYSFSAKVWNEVSEAGKDFVRKLLVKSPNGRMSAQQALEHDWLRKER